MLRLRAFELSQPRTVEEAVQALDATSMVIAGGSDLLPKLKREQFDPRTLVSLDAIEGLDRIERDGERLRIGAMVRLRDLERSVELEAWPLLRQAVGSIATPTLRGMGTVGGNLCQDTRCHYIDRGAQWRESAGYCMKKGAEICRVAPGSSRCHASFCSDLAPALISLNASVTLQGEARRVIPLAQLYRDDGMRHLDLRGELLVAVDLPRHPAFGRYFKLAPRGAFDFPELGLAVAIDRRERLVVHVAMSAVASYVQSWQCECKADELLDFADEILSDVKPIDTLWFPPDYRKSVARAKLLECFQEFVRS